MWRKEDGKPQESGEASAGLAGSTSPLSVGADSGKDRVKPTHVSSKAAACVSQGIKIKGEVSGSEDLFVDGLLEGNVALRNAILTIGPNAHVKADITAGEVVVRGRVEGKLTGAARIEVWHTARIEGDLKAEKIAIEEGAELHGHMEAGKPLSKADERQNIESSIKTETDKRNDETPGEETAASGAALAGAD
jgi:cytoskeletal protein CcmA (bactofilin family)